MQELLQAFGKLASHHPLCSVESDAVVIILRKGHSQERGRVRTVRTQTRNKMK